jgi:signal transduction histidine kinase
MEAKVIVLSNQIALILLLVASTFTVLNILQEEYVRGFSSAVFIPFLFLLIRLNKWGKNTIVRVVVCVFPMIFILLPPVLFGGVLPGTGKNYSIVLLGLSQMPFVLFRGNRENSLLYSCLVFNVFCLFSYNILIEFLGDVRPDVPVFWSDKAKEMLCFLIIGCIVWFKTRLNEQALSEVNDLNSSLITRNEEIKELAHQLQQQHDLLDEQFKLLESRNQELAQSEAQLEQKVLERTHVLSTQNQMLEEYSFYVSHVLRSPLSGMMGMLNLLKMDKSQLQQRDFLDKLEANIQQIDDVVKELNGKLREKSS